MKTFILLLFIENLLLVVQSGWGSDTKHINPSSFGSKSVLGTSCLGCITKGHTLCLDADLSKAWCCHPEDYTRFYCENDFKGKLHMCSTKETIKSDLLRKFTCSPDKTKCPIGAAQTSILLEKLNEPKALRHDWTVQVPTVAARDWHCKMKISAASKLVNSMKGAGYIAFTTELNGFLHDVDIIVQKRN